MAPAHSKPDIGSSRPNTRTAVTPKGTKAKASSSKTQAAPAPAAEDSDAEGAQQTVKVGKKGKKGKKGVKGKEEKGVVEEDGEEEDGEEDEEEGREEGGRGGCQPGARNYMDEMCEYLCDRVEEMLPHGNAGWDLLAAKFNTKFPEWTHDRNWLKKKFLDLANVNPIPTGNKPMDLIHRRAIEIKDLLTAAVNSVSLNDEVVPKGFNNTDAGKSEGDDSNVPTSGGPPTMWPTSEEDEGDQQGKGSALSVQIIDPPPKKTPSKTTESKSGPKVKPKPKPKSKQVEPFPVSVLKKVKNEAESSTKVKEPVVLDEDDSSSVEVLGEPASTTKQGKRKAEDEGTMVVRKKPAAPTSTPSAKSSRAPERRFCSLFCWSTRESTIGAPGRSKRSRVLLRPRLVLWST
ncbi:hypothetical protein FRC08_008232 [Ceratobasidium sp. 394]|nr:hypothetical protein FRC08_008232 [Ceratobasidium sp. 394]